MSSAKSDSAGEGHVRTSLGVVTSAYLQPPKRIGSRQNGIAAPELSLFYRRSGISKTSNPVFSKGS
jgi:hypothetical protein